VVCAVDNPKLELRPGMTATITITTANADDALRVPVRAIRFRPERAPTPEGQPTRKPGSGGGGDGAHRGGQRSPAVFVPDADGGMKRI